VHRLEYPECDGVIRIIFRSAPSDRRHLSTPRTANAPSALLTTPKAQAPVGKPAGRW
jgi:hypothetical protein